MRILKIGGNEIDDLSFIEQLGQAITELSEIPILVHGGGKEIKELQARLGLEAQYIDGLRVTDAESLDLVQMVLIGRINKRLVASLAQAGLDAFGMSGVDRACIMAKKLEHPNGDLGYVGQVTQVREEVFKNLLDNAVIPVLSPLCYSAEGTIFNVNADQVAMAVAVSLGAEELTFISNVPGVLNQDKIMTHLTPTQTNALITEQIITGGMIPKVRSALEAVEAGVKAVRITNLAGLQQGTGTVLRET